METEDPPTGSKGHRVKEKLEILEEMYALHDRALADLGMGDTACGKGCDSCCTCNVTLTGLEMDYIRQGLDEAGRQRILELAQTRAPEPRFRPRLTLNGFAKACMDGRDVPEEENDPNWGKCPLLGDDGACTIYPLRPFGCRSLVSTHSCAQKGYADMAPEILTLNNVFIQFIEHLDQGGAMGNFSDMIQNIDSDGLIKNQPIPVIMVEPDFQDRLVPVIQQIQALLT